jgi:hypothetical protein
MQGGHVDLDLEETQGMVDSLAASECFRWEDTVCTRESEQWNFLP